MQGIRKFTDAQVIEIKQLLKENKVKTEWICNKFDCTRADINNIKNRGYYSELDKYVSCSEEELFHHEKDK